MCKSVDEVILYNMFKKNLPGKLLSVVLPAVILVMMTRIDIKPYLMDYINKLNSIPGYIKESDSKKISFESIINSYMPVVGYVESNYVETEYIDDPYYNYDDGIEYIELGESEISGLTGSENVVEIPEDEEIIPEPVVAAKFNKMDLLDFNNLLSRLYTVASITELKEEKFNVTQALEQDMTIKQDNSAPQILIFHTHSLRICDVSNSKNVKIRYRSSRSSPL